MPGIHNTEVAKLFRIPSLWFIAFFSLGLFGYVLSSVNYFNAIPGDLGDARFNSVILEHLYHWVIDTNIDLWSPAFFYPFEGTLAFSDNHFGSALPYIILRSLGLERELAFDGWFVIGCCLNFITAYAVMRRFEFSAFGSAAGAFVFAFALPALPKEGHAQLVYRFAIPIAFAAFFDLLSSRNLARLWQVAFWVTIQFYCSIYLGIFLLYLLLATLLAVKSLKYGRNLFHDLSSSIYREPARPLIFSGAITLLCSSALLWLMYNYYMVSSAYGFARPKAEVISMLPQLSSYLIADRAQLSSWIGSSFSTGAMRHEHQMFFGIGVWALGIIGLLSVIRNGFYENIGKISALSLLILFIMTLYIGGESLYKLLMYLPGISSIRAVSRIVLVMLLPAGILVAIGSDRLLYLWAQTKQKRIYIGSAVLLLLGLEVIAYKPANTPIEIWHSRQDALHQILPGTIPTDAILFVSQKGREPFYYSELDGMILSQDLNIPTLNGYSGNLPPGYLNQSPCAPLVNRLHGYASHNNAPPGEIDRLVNRTIHLKPEPCNPITDTQAVQIKFTVSNQQISDKHLSIDIMIKNNSNSDIDSSTTAGYPLRMSWRFVPVNQEGKALSDPNWDTRQNIGRSILSGKSVTASISTNIPDEHKNYILELSMVLEGVSWLHDIGMTTCKIPLSASTNEAIDCN